MKTIAIVGEFTQDSKSQVFLNQALSDIKKRYGYDFGFEWVDTAKVEAEKENLLKNYSGIWSAPGGKFNSLEGALLAIKYARENNIPHLGTCGGFQHTILEFARNVLGIKDAQHEEYDPNASTLFITKLACSLAGQRLKITVKKDTRAFACYNKTEIEEDYYCSFGINPAFREQLNRSDLIISGVDTDNEIRIFELPKHKFFMATLFVPQANSTFNQPHPIVLEFVKNCL